MYILHILRSSYSLLTSGRYTLALYTHLPCAKLLCINSRTDPSRLPLSHHSARPSRSSPNTPWIGLAECIRARVHSIAIRPLPLPANNQIIANSKQAIAVAAIGSLQTERNSDSSVSSRSVAERHIRESDNDKGAYRETDPGGGRPRSSQLSGSTVSADESKLFCSSNKTFPH